MMAVNRGARGWEAPGPTVVMTVEEMASEIERVQRLQDAFENGILDLIPVNGVWMTPEDARKA